MTSINGPFEVAVKTSIYPGKIFSSISMFDTYVNISNFKTRSQSSVHDLDENIFHLLYFVMRSFGGTFRLSQCIVKIFFSRLKRSLSLVTEQKKKKGKTCENITSSM